ncbi:unnamed protein product [Adineta steineri]|uniref:Sulfotransferase domain-containing protein n=1 Tax=Adineta steineri TaxID=433720 RepID=A0A818JYZ0_9BILA|nr:unnamed protein product [Adineta steineri]CAF3550941.1 unnamed protein product [Adineta steineri]
MEATNSNLFLNIKGMRFFSKLYNLEIVHSALEYIPHDSDIFIATIPKSGTTWMQTIVYALLMNGRAFDDDINDYKARNPFLEMDGQQAIESMQRPGAIKTHLIFNYLPYNSNAKYINVIRNPKDVCVSFHRFITSIGRGAQNDIAFDTFFNDFLAGKTGHVDYFEHLISCWAHRNDDNVLLILYEDMQKDIRSVIKRVANFLDIKISEELLERIVIVSSFDYLNKARYNEKIDSKDNVATFKFLRKGITGDWRTVLSDEQNRRLETCFREKTKHIHELNTLWDQYDVFNKE